LESPSVDSDENDIQPITYAWISTQVLQKQLGWSKLQADRIRKALGSNPYPSSRLLHKQMYTRFKTQFEAAAKRDVRLQQHAPKKASNHCRLYDFDIAMKKIVQNM
jgi:hypothetical protein